MGMSAREMLARMIRCEAEGEGVDGMKAVATVIMNRVNVPYGEYLRTGEGDLRKVLVQACQFSCYKTRIAGQQNLQNIFNMTPEPIHYEIADWAIGGNIHWPVAECLWYMNPFNPNCPQNFPYNGTGYYYRRINQHCFFRPTSLYRET